MSAWLRRHAATLHSPLAFIALGWICAYVLLGQPWEWTVYPFIVLGAALVYCLYRLGAAAAARRPPRTGA